MDVFSQLTNTYVLRLILKDVLVSIVFLSKHFLKFLKYCAGVRGRESLRDDRMVLVYAELIIPPDAAR